MWAEKTPAPPRFLSIEFFVYYVQIAIAYIAMGTMLYSLSNEFAKFHFGNGLSLGWMGGRLVDSTDHQWNAYRRNFPLLMAASALYVLISRWARSRRSPRFHIYVLAVINVAAIFVVHRSTAPFALLVVIVNYMIGRIFAGSRLNPILSWTFAAAYMVYNEKYGFYFANISPSLWYLDQYRPLYRFSQCLNLCMLKMVSHNMDLYWTRRQRISPMKWTDHEKFCATCAAGSECYDKRSELNPPTEHFSLPAYFAYVFYVPLYITGPTINFNAFISQIYSPQRAMNLKTVIIYGLRTCGAMLLLELMLHFWYAVAVTKHTDSWAAFSPGEVGSIGYFVLMFLWLKFFAMWRFSRFWALLDGIEAPENMTRCVNNNYTMSGFWRGWHRSFNRWLIRYVYVPLGGSKYKYYNIWVVFTFVALWHDMTMQLLAWSWLICVFLLIEYAGVFVSRRLRLNRLSYYRYIAGFGAAFNILLMMIANLVGFSVGPTGMRVVLQRVFRLEGVIFLLEMFITFFAASQIMFELERFRKTKD